MKRTILSLLLSLAPLADTTSPAPSVPAWQFNLKAESSGVVALESMVVSPNLAIFFNRASNDPLQINGHSAWGALFNLQTGDVRALHVLTNSFCGGGAFLSNGSMVSASLSHSIRLLIHTMHSIVGEYRWGRARISG